MDCKKAQPVKPVEGMVGVVIGTILGRAQEQVPMDVSRDGRTFCGARDNTGRLRPNGTIGPNMNLANWANGTRTNDLHRLAESVLGGALVAHLRGNFGALRGFTHQAGFVDRVNQRLLAINMFPLLNGLVCNGKVAMIRYGNIYRIDIGLRNQTHGNFTS